MEFEIKWNWFKRLFYRSELYKEYIQCKDVFREPRMMCYMGSWKKNPMLPVWRRGNDIYLAPWRYRQWVKKGKTWDEGEVCVWRDEVKEKFPILTKIIRPHYRLPYYLSCFLFNYGLGWKLKWDDYRYEYPPGITLVLFGFSISLWLVPPIDTKTGEPHSDYDYWEAILNYIDCKDINEVKKRMGSWQTYKDGKYINVREACNDDFLKK